MIKQKKIEKSKQDVCVLNLLEYLPKKKKKKNLTLIAVFSA